MNNSDNEKAPSEQARQSAALINGASRVLWCSRAAALVMILVCLIIGGKFWAIGAALGGLVVEINLSLLTRVLKKAGQWQGRTLFPTLMRFYLTFGATIVACVLIIRNQWGHPLAFLGGLLSFFIGLVLALVSLAVKRPESPEEK